MGMIVSVKQFMARLSGSGPLDSLGGDVQSTGLKLSLRCPISGRRLAVPVRGFECQHIQVLHYITIIIIIMIIWNALQLLCIVLLVSLNE